MAPTFSSKPFFNDERPFKSAVEDQEGSSFLSEPARSTPSSRTAYYFPKGVGEYHFGEKHPMKPHRLTLTNHLVMGYDLHKSMDIYQPRLASRDELTAFHAEDYVDFLSRVTPDSIVEHTDTLGRFNIGEDCPIFDSLFDYCRQYSGASLAAARKLASGSTDIAVNWTGGLHHAKKVQASGFCYINDIVLAILELLRVHPRVLYIDIDIHHGDGVQEAFYNTNRVLTVSFHKYAEHFFPGTGHIDELGSALGQYFSLNVPLQDGIDNESYISLFKAVMEPAIHTFQPSAIVLQCGADSLGCDRLGAFNLSISAHGECVRFIKDFKIPLLVVGGGGYTVKNVARCWTYETAVLLDKQKDISNALPSTVYDDYFAPDYKLHPPLTGRVENNNTRAGLERIRVGLLERIRFMQGAPSVQLQEIPPSLASWLEQEEEKLAKDPDAHRDLRNAFDSRRDQDQEPTPDVDFVKPLPPQSATSTAGSGQRRSGGGGGRRSMPGAERKRKRTSTATGAAAGTANGTAAAAGGSERAGGKTKGTSKQSTAQTTTAEEPQQSSNFTMDLDENEPSTPSQPSATVLLDEGAMPIMTPPQPNPSILTAAATTATPAAEEGLGASAHDGTPV